MPDPSLRDILINRVLPRVQFPGQYIGGEWNSICKDRAAVRGRLCLAFPEPYTIGMSHYGLQVLYAIMNGRERLGLRAGLHAADRPGIVAAGAGPAAGQPGEFHAAAGVRRRRLQPATRAQRDERADDARSGRNPPGGRIPQHGRSADSGRRPRLGQPGADGPLHRRLRAGRRRRGAAGGVRSVAGNAAGAGSIGRPPWPAWRPPCPIVYVPRFYQPQFDARGRPAGRAAAARRSAAEHRTGRGAGPRRRRRALGPDRAAASSAFTSGSPSRSCGVVRGAAASARAVP